MRAILMLQKKDKEGVVLDTVYFAGFKRLPNKATDGPLFTHEQSEAYHFDRRDFALNVLHGDERLQGFEAREVM